MHRDVDLFCAFSFFPAQKAFGEMVTKRIGETPEEFIEREKKASIAKYQRRKAREEAAKAIEVDRVKAAKAAEAERLARRRASNRRASQKYYEKKVREAASRDHDGNNTRRSQQHGEALSCPPPRNATTS